MKTEIESINGIKICDATARKSIDGLSTQVSTNSNNIENINSQLAAVKKQIEDNSEEIKYVKALYLDYSQLAFTTLTSKTLTATKYGLDDETVTWTTSSSGVATVSNGVVEAVANGSCTITATCGDKTATCNVIVGVAQEGGTPVSTTSNLSMTWESGSISGNGALTSSSTKIRTKTFLSINRGSTLTVASGYAYILIHYNDDGTIESFTGWQSTNYTFNFAGKYKIILKKTSEASISASDGSNATVTQMNNPSDALNTASILVGKSYGTDSSLVSHQKRICTVLMNPNSTVKLKSDSSTVNVMFVTCNSSDKYVSSDSYTSSTTEVTKNNVGYCRLIIKETPEVVYVATNFDNNWNITDTKLSTINTLLGKVHLTKVVSGTAATTETDVSCAIPEPTIDNFYPLSAEFELGSINTSGTLISSTTVIRTKDFINANQGTTFHVKDGYKMLAMLYDENGVLETYTSWQTDDYTLDESKKVKILLKNATDGTTITVDEKSNVGTIGKLNSSTTSNKAFSISIESLGKITNTLTSTSNDDYILCAIKNQFVTSKPSVPVGYLYHSKDSNNKKIYYSPNQIDRPIETGTLTFNPNTWVVAVSPNHGDVIFCKYDNRTAPKVYANGTETTISGLSENPIGWLQNSGCDFGLDSNGNEYFMFGEYTGNNYSSGSYDHVNVWKVTYPYNVASNWTIVKTLTRASAYTASEDGKVWHIHTCERDPYKNIWYVTTGDTEKSTQWWYSTNTTTWTKFHNGEVWDSQVARVLNFVFTEDYIYWGNDYGTNHCFSRLSRNASTGRIDISTYKKLAELNKNQSSYATLYLENPHGILSVDRVDTAFAENTDKIYLQFYSIDEGKLYNLKTFKRLSSKSSYFGFRCKCYTLRQSIFDRRIAMGFDTGVPNWIDIQGNESEGLVTVIFDIQ